MKRFIPGPERFAKSRFEAFTDGVFAVAITLLIVDFRVPELADPTDGTMRAYLLTLGGPLLTFVLSFGTVGIIWTSHHTAFEHIDEVDRATVLLTLCLLATVCFVPFPTALLARYGPLPSSTALYGATMFLMGIAFGVSVWQASVHNAVANGRGASPVSFARLALRFFGTALYAVGVLLAFVAPLASIVLYVCAALYYLLVPGLFGPVERAGA